jgi:hypothetical protein
MGVVAGCFGSRWGVGDVLDKPLGGSARVRTSGRQVVWTIRSPFLSS